MYISLSEFIKIVDLKEDKLMNENDNNISIDEVNADSLVNLGAAYYNGTDGLKQDFNIAFKYYNLAAKMGNIIALSNLGYCYMYGRGVPKDMDMAFSCFQKAADGGDVNATYKIGDFYMWGKNAVEVDKQKAVEYYVKAYKMATDEARTDNFDLFNFPDVCIRLADCYFYGTGKEQDYEKALNLYMTATSFFDLRIELGDEFSDDLYARAVSGVQKCKRQLNK